MSDKSGTDMLISSGQCFVKKRIIQLGPEYLKFLLFIFPKSRVLMNFNSKNFTVFTFIHLSSSSSPLLTQTSSFSANQSASSIKATIPSCLYFFLLEFLSSRSVFFFLWQLKELYKTNDFGLFKSNCAIHI